MRKISLTSNFLLVLPLLLLASCATSDYPKKINIRIEGEEKVSRIKIESEFVLSDLEIAAKSLNLISQIDTNQVYPYIPLALYWGDLPGLYGATLKREFLVNSNGIYSIITNQMIVFNSKLIKPKTNSTNLMDYIFYGSIISHELHHYFYDSNDPLTHQLTDYIIYNKIRERPEILKTLKF